MRLQWFIVQRQRGRLAIKEGKGLVWMVVTVLCAVLLAGAIAASVALEVTSNNTRNKDRASIAKLENKIVELDKQAKPYISD